MTRLSSSSSLQPQTKKKSVVSMWMAIQLLLIWTISAATAASFQSSVTRKIGTGLGRPTAFAGDISLLKSSSLILSIRGGDSSDDESIDFDDESSEEEDSEDEDLEDEDSEDEEEEDSEEEEDDEEEPQQVVSAEPIKVMIRTNLGNTVVDQTLELQVSRNRNVASVKQSIMRQMPGRPPMSCQILMWGSQVLEDDQLVNELVDDEDEDEEEDEEGSTLTLILDVVPPIDPKFATEMMDRMKHMTTSQLLDAYLANQAGLYENARTLHEETTNSVQSKDDEDDDDNDDIISTFMSQPQMARSVQLRQEAYQMRQDLVGTFDEKVLEILEKDDAPSTLALQSNIERRGERIRTPGSRGGAKANVRRVLQKNLNINWPDTIRNFFLFLFFGLFGGRSTISKHLLLLGAPACFVLQVRPVKILVKQLFYTLSNPPGIFLTLMPAPQQAILSFDIDDAREKLYGPTTASSDAASQQNVEEDMDDESSSSMTDEDDDSDSSDYDSDSDGEDNSDSEEDADTDDEEYDSDY